MKNKLNSKDLMTIGIYSVIYLLVMLIIAMTGFIPILLPMLGAMVALLGGIPFMLFLTKVKKFGMIWIMGIIVGCVMFLGGMTYWPIITGFIFALFADALLKSGDYKNKKQNILGYTIFSMWVAGNYIVFFVEKESLYNEMCVKFGEEYAKAVLTFFPNWMFPVLIVSIIAFGIIGGFIGIKMNKKHFERIGISK